MPTRAKRAPRQARNSELEPQWRQQSPLGVAPKLPKKGQQRTKRAPTKKTGGANKISRGRRNSQKGANKKTKGPQQKKTGGTNKISRGCAQAPRCQKQNFHCASNQIQYDFLRRPIAQQKTGKSQTKLEFVRPRTHFTPMGSSNLGANSGGDPWPFFLATPSRLLLPRSWGPLGSPTNSPMTYPPPRLRLRHSLRHMT